MWSRAIVPIALAALSCGCASQFVYRDAEATPERGRFEVERAKDGAYYGRLTGYFEDTSPRSDAVDVEFWSRAAAFCKGSVEKLDDNLCIIHWKTSAPDPSADPGRCKMANFRCKAAT